MVRRSLHIALFQILLLLPGTLFAQEAKNPKALIGDPWLARLQQGRKELTEQEKKDLKRAGYTGLELMTYVHANQRPGEKGSEYFRWIRATDIGGIQTSMYLLKTKHYYKNYRALLAGDGIEPGDVEFKRSGYYFLPVHTKGDTWLQVTTHKSSTNYKRSTGLFRPASLKRARSVTMPDRSVNYYHSLSTHDDFFVRQPWEEEHRILGDDACGMKSCYVVESKNWFVKNPYYSRRVTWVDKESFVDVHEEQFNPRRHLFKVMDKEWELHSSGYWVIKRWIVVDLESGNKSLEDRLEWAIDQGQSEMEFSSRMLEKEDPWKTSTLSPPPIEKASDFPPDPEVRRDFWKKIGKHPTLVGKGQALTP